MGEYFHSVSLIKDKCKGCTNCIKKCPTEAIRVRDGKAKITDERCIDCGECIRTCPYHAKIAITDPFDIIYNYKFKVALPAPTFYGQFNRVLDVNLILTSLIEIGFDAVYEVAQAAEIVTYATKQYFKTGNVKKPAISSACPAVVRLIQVRFPNLIDNIIPLSSPMDIAAKLAKEKFSKEQGLDEKDVGVFFISPCAAKVTDSKAPVGFDVSHIDGVISMNDVYMKVAPIIKKIDNIQDLSVAGFKGIGWANSGGESAALGTENSIGVDGIHNVIKILEEIEDDKLLDVDFIELLACTGGCVGGPLTVENNFVAKNRVRKIAELNKDKSSIEESNYEEIKQKRFSWTNSLVHNPVMKLDNNMVEAMKKMEALEKIYEELPGLDCGSCGAPTCRALAEDIVRGNATKTDCIFMFRDRIRELTKELVDIESHMPPTLRKEGEDDEG